jgi:hypothetical protein
MATVSVAALAALLPAAPAQAQDSPCDPEILRSAAERPHDYQFRGDRCEGIYASDVSGQALWLASFTERFDAYAFNYEPLSVQWTAPGGAAVSLRGHGIRQGLYYRMDSQRPAGSHAYEWNSELLAVREIGRPDLGIIAWTEGEGGTDLLVPVRVSQGESGPAEGRTYEVLVMPNVRLREIYVTLARVDAAGQRPTGDLLRNREPLGQRLYATQRPVVIEIPDPGATGVYFLEIVGVQADGGSANLDPVWFYHQGS